MDNFNLTSFTTKFSYKKVPVVPVKPSVAQSATSSAQTSSSKAVSSGASGASGAAAAAKTAAFGGSEQAVYVRELLQFPKNLNEFIYMVQRGYTQAQMTRLLMQQSALQRSMSPSQAQILAQLQELSTEDLQNVLKSQLASQTSTSAGALKNLQILSNGNINLAELANLLQNNGKEAITKLILTMANVSKQGDGDLSRLRETAKLINASIALSAQENTNQTLKTLLLLYLPWLPLQEGTDFEVEVRGGGGEEDEDSILVITVSTINFGKVVATFVLETSNSVHINIECSKDFPKEELLSRIQRDEKQHAMQSVVTFAGLESRSESEEVTRASVTMSQMKEINPFMLLAAHSFIRNTIMIDNEATNGVVTHED